MVRKLRKESGFTLVELLIVVAIIGVLATVGIPTFKRMMQKSKKAEAKVNLGNLFTTEAAFYSEYGAYGDNLVAMGFEIDGTTGADVTYRVGFLKTGNTGWACPANTAASEPSKAVAPSAYASVNLAIPTYYSYAVTNYAIGSTGQNIVDGFQCNGFGRYSDGVTTPNVLMVSTDAMALGFPKKPDTYQYTFFGVQTDNKVGAGAQTDNAYLATAQGVIAGGLNKNTPANALQLDVWSIDEQRDLTNLQDGVL